jgi:hypothetical protein
MTVLTEDIANDRVECPLRECIRVGILRLVDVRVLGQMHTELAKGPISSGSWYDHYK